jgi:hypothetical protein
MQTGIIASEFTEIQRNRATSLIECAHSVCDVEGVGFDLNTFD